MSSTTCAAATIVKNDVWNFYVNVAPMSDCYRQIVNLISDYLPYVKAEETWPFMFHHNAYLIKAYPAFLFH
jgi:hypothetical protein